MTKYNAITHLEGKLWTLPDYPWEEPDRKKFEKTDDLDGYLKEKIDFDCARELSFKWKVKFKEQTEVMKIVCGSIKPELNWGNAEVELKEGEVYPRPAGFIIETKKECTFKAPCSCGPLTYPCNQSKTYALLLPIKKEKPRITREDILKDLTDWKNGKMGYRALIDAIDRYAESKPKEEQLANPSHSYTPSK